MEKKHSRMDINRKTFYSMIRIQNTVMLKERDGYEVEIAGKKFNAYKSEVDRRIYIIDPKNGTALAKYDCESQIGDIPSEMELIRMAKEKLQKNGVVEKWKKKRRGKEYRQLVKMFKEYKKAEFHRMKAVGIIEDRGQIGVNRK